MKRTNTFRRGYGLYVLVLCVVFLLALALLWIALMNYQNRVDAESAAQAAEAARTAGENARLREEREAPQRELESFLNGTSAGDWRDLWMERNPGGMDDPERLERYFSDRREELAPYKDESWSAGRPVYLLRCGDRDFARVTLAGSGTDWRTESVDFLFSGEKSGRIETLSCFSVLCNGVHLGADCLSAHSVLAPAPGYGEVLEDPLYLDCYEVSGLLLEPVLETEPNGAVTLQESPPDGRAIPADLSEEAAAAAEKGESFVKAVLNYYMSGEENTEGNFYSCLSYVPAGSPAYETLLESLDGVSWNPAYSSRDVSDTHASTPLSWGSNCCSVDVAFHAVCSYQGKEIDYAGGSYRLIFLRSGGDYALVDMFYQ